MKKLEEIQRAIVSSKEEVLSELTGKISLLEEKLENEVESLRTENVYLRTRIDELEQYGMKNDVIIRGVKDEKDETCEALIEKTKEIAKKLRVNLESNKIIEIHRLQSWKLQIHTVHYTIQHT